MKIVQVVGSSGVMGKRYVEALNDFRSAVTVVETDIYDDINYDVDASIVATPTATHFDICKDLVNHRMTVLCEKPVSKDLYTVKFLNEYAYSTNTPLFMVCNWAYAHPLKHLEPGQHTIRYNCRRTGDDGQDWDCIQLHYLAKDLVIERTADELECFIDGERITVDDIMNSYRSMVRDFIRAIYYLDHKLWGHKDIIKAHEAVQCKK